MAKTLFNPTKILSILLASSILAFSSFLPAETDNGIESLIENYQEPVKSELKRGIELVQKKHKGKIISAKPIIKNESPHFMVRMLLDDGRLKTFYVDRSNSKIIE